MRKRRDDRWSCVRNRPVSTVRPSQRPVVCHPSSSCRDSHTSRPIHRSSTRNSPESELASRVTANSRSSSVCATHRSASPDGCRSIESPVRIRPCWTSAFVTSEILGRLSDGDRSDHCTVITVSVWRTQTLVRKVVRSKKSDSDDRYAHRKPEERFPVKHHEHHRPTREHRKGRQFVGRSEPGGKTATKPSPLRDRVETSVEFVSYLIRGE